MVAHGSFWLARISAHSCPIVLARATTIKLARPVCSKTTRKVSPTRTRTHTHTHTHSRSHESGSVQLCVLTAMGTAARSRVFGLESKGNAAGGATEVRLFLQSVESVQTAAEFARKHVPTVGRIRLHVRASLVWVLCRGARRQSELGDRHNDHRMTSPALSTQCSFFLRNAHASLHDMNLTGTPVTFLCY